MQVIDPWGETEYAYIEFDVLNSVSFDEPYATGFAITEEDATASTSMLLPHLGKNYGIGGGDSPLMMIDVSIDAASEDDPGLRSLDLSLNLTNILPENIDLSTVDLRYLSDIDSVDWEFLDGVDTYTFDPDFTEVDVSMTKDGVILIIGILPTADVTATGVEWSQLEGGQIELNWTGTGDLTNPYVGGWNVYKIAGIAGTTVFPDTTEGVNENIWEELTLETKATTLSLNTVNWLDPDPLETGICASYAIIPIDREGNANLQRANITRVDGAAAQLCGDAIPPTTTLIDLKHTWVFTNDTGCFEQQQDWSLCYNATLSWTWPAHEAQGELTWNVYRVETRPVDIDLRFIEPMISGLTGTPGEQGSLCKAALTETASNPCVLTTTSSHPSTVSATR